MNRLISNLKVVLGIPVTMTGKDFIDLNENIFDKNENKEKQIAFLKANDLYEKVGTFEISGGRVGIIESLK